VFFRKELHELLVACDLYNRLLFFFDKYPFHNILHQKICDIFIYLLDKGSESEDIINSVLYDTDLVKKILDTAREGSSYTLKSTSLTVASGYMPFVRKLANKLHSLSTTSKIEEVANFLDSIPEWNEFLNNHLIKQNELESKQLGNKKTKNDADLDYD
jgi:SIT4 phosphatase-associated protein